MLENAELIDISPLISPKIAVFPGDTPFSRELLMNCQEGEDHLTLSSIKTTVHLGAHTDAPNHYHKKGESIDQRELSFYLGKAQVIEVHIEKGTRIVPKDLNVEIKAPRVLFKTSSFPDPNKWRDDFNALSRELILFLKEKGVILVGIDTPSVDLSTDKNLESHLTIYENNMAILEGIVLDKVEDGIYQLISLPLKLKEADASPVRAVLLKERL